MAPRNVYSIDAGLPFARDLAVGVKKLAATPERLARGLILLPSRRAARALQEAFLDVSSGQPMLLPRMLPIGELGGDDGLADAIGGLGVDAGLPPAISALRRQVILAKLLRHFPLGGVRPSHPQAMLLAQSLADLMDQLYNADATAAQLTSLLPDQFSAHWQDIMTLLQILIERWPNLLAGEGVMDAVDRRNQLVRRRAAAWQAAPPDQLIVVAGSTGSIAATRSLISVVATLPDGHVVLPGLDRMAQSQWAAISTDSGHPQYQLAQLLLHLDMTPDEVQDWVSVSADAPPTLAARRRLMREVFRPAVLSARWQQLGGASDLIEQNALDGLKLVTGRDRREEAGLVALMLREVLETPEKTAALVTPDRQLAELVIADLARWQIQIEDSAGQRLALTAVGRFLQLLADAVSSDFAPVPLLSLLKHPFAAGGMAPNAFRRQVDRVELAALRGLRPEGGLQGLLERLKDPLLRQFLTHHVIDNLQPLIKAWAAPNPTLASLAAGLADAAELLASPDMVHADAAASRGGGALLLWQGSAGKVASDLLRDLAVDGHDVAIDSDDMPQIFRQFLESQTVHPHGSPHPRLAILGAVEARMQPAQAVEKHRIILAGFNEGHWPPHPDVDPWMNAAMREAVGLPPRNWRSGLSAHDVYMASCSREVIITRAEKDAGTPTTKSRWLQRLEVVLNALGLEGSIDTGKQEMDWFQQLHPVASPKPASRPTPIPPIKARPRRFSATEIDVWMTDPYAIYAKKILRLKPLDPVDRPSDAALRGTLFHDALAEFTTAHARGELDETALDELLAIGRNVFDRQIQTPSTRMFWWPRFEAVAKWFIETEHNRRANLAEVYAETKGQIMLNAPAGMITLSARADRLERDHHGNLTIIDYKTGVVPSQKQVRDGIRNQLAVEGLIAAEGGFGGLAPGIVLALEYWQISGRKFAPGVIQSRLTNVFDAELMRQRLEALAAHYDNPQSSYPSEPDPTTVPTFKPYEHLSRSLEWRNGGSHEE